MVGSMAALSATTEHLSLKRSHKILRQRGGVVHKLRLNSLARINQGGLGTMGLGTLGSLGEAAETWRMHVISLIQYCNPRPTTSLSSFQGTMVGRRRDAASRRRRRSTPPRNSGARPTSQVRPPATGIRRDGLQPLLQSLPRLECASWAPGPTETAMSRDHEISIAASNY